MSMRGIHPTIVVVILVAVTIAISIAVAGWLMGVWHVESTEKYEGLEVLPGSYFDSSNSSLILRLRAQIRPEVIITEVWVSGANVTNVSLVNVESGTAVQQGSVIKASPGTVFVVRIDVDHSFAPGTAVSFKIFTENGFVYPSQVYSK
ncbi:MAG: hypothetical protein GSR81_04145 [Desulfurococcales archaeon]|nr:hypothetical protein [Desulfurococcales archaeon]